MDLTGLNSLDRATEKTKQEHVEKEKQEYKYLTSYLRTRGLNLFCYNPMTDRIEAVEIRRGKTIHIVPMGGVLTPVDYEMEKSVVDPRCYFFQSLKWETAERRVSRWKKGEIKELCNLRKPEEGVLKFW